MAANDWTGTIPTFTAGERVRASKLQTLSDILTARTGASGTWTPTLSGITVGTGGSAATVARYNRANKRVEYIFAVTLGSSGAAVANPPTFTLPATPATYYGSTLPIGIATYLDVSASQRWEGIAYNLSAAVATLFYATEAGGGSGTSITNALPFTWAAGDQLVCWGSYETA